MPRLQWVDDDGITLGEIEIGESLQGMNPIGQAAPRNKLAGVRQQLQQLAGNRFSKHAPLKKEIPSPYLDQKPMSILATGVITPAMYVVGAAYPTIPGRQRVYKDFKAEKIVITELVTATFTASGQANVVGYAKVPQAGDVLIMSGSSGVDPWFPTAVTPDAAIDAESFSSGALGVGVSLPTVQGGYDAVVTYIIMPTVLAAVAAPTGFTLSTLTVEVRMTLIGPSLR
jgi:hypothetical protein